MKSQRNKNNKIEVCIYVEKSREKRVIVKNDEKRLINSLASFIASQDIDEFLCKKVICRREENGIDVGDDYDCMDCIIEYFLKPCKWKAENDVCVNGDCEHCADFVSEMECGKCYLKELGDANV